MEIESANMNTAVE